MILSYHPFFYYSSCIQQTMEKLKSRKERFEYVGSLAEYQTLAQDRVMEYEIDSYNSYQNYLFKRALYGLKGVSQEELAAMCDKKKQRINRVYFKGQQVINLYKQRVTNFYSNLVFKQFFPDSPITEFLSNMTETDPNFKNTLTFKDLNISKDDIIKVFIKEGILPKNFMDLNTDPNALPRLKSK
jgi:hypothetical protein